MCSTCNSKNYYEISLKEGSTTLQQDLGEGSLVIRYNPNTKKYSIAVKTEWRSEFTIYRCPTCGRQLF